MNNLLKRVLAGVGGVLGVAVLGLGGYVFLEARAFDASMDKVYDFPVPEVTLSTDPAVLARGRHLAESLAGCALGDCHGADLGGGKKMEIGPIGTFQPPNITAGGLGAVYSDGELVRLIRHGVKKDGRSVRFMPVGDFNWLPEEDVAAIVSYVRSVPKVDRPNGEIRVGLLAKVLDSLDMMPLDIARRVEHGKMDRPPLPAPTAEYGKFIGRLCTGCHGDHLSGGPIPGVPESMGIPLNLTPHVTGLAGWTYEDFLRVFETGKRKDGRKLAEMMPTEVVKHMDDVERHALWEYLRGVPPLAFGNR